MRSKKKTVGMKKRRKRTQQTKRSKKATAMIKSISKKKKQPKRSKKAMAMIKFIMRWRLFPPPEYPYPSSSKGGSNKSKKRKVRFQESSPGSVHENHAGELKIEPIPEIIGSNEGVFFLKLDRDAQAILSCIIGKDLLLERNWKYIQKEIITNDITEKGEDSKFYPILEALETSPNDYVLVIFDKNVDAYYLFFSVNPLRHIQNLAAKFMSCVRWIKFGIQRTNPPLAHFEAQEAKKISKKIFKERLTVERKRMRVICYGSIEAMKLREHHLSSVEAKDLEGGYINNLMRKRPSEEDIAVVQKGIDSIKKGKYRGVKDVGVQIFPETTKQSIQAFPHGISNKSVQKSFDCIKSKKSIYRTYGSVLLISDACIQFLSFSLEEINIKDLCPDYAQGFFGKAQKNENDNSEKCMIGTYFLGEHHVLPVQYYSKHNYTEIFDLSCFQRVSCIAWHPRYIDMVAIAYRNYVYEVKKVKFENIDFLDKDDNEDKAKEDGSVKNSDGSLLADTVFDYDVNIDDAFSDVSDEIAQNATHLKNIDFALALSNDTHVFSSDDEEEHEDGIVVDNDSDHDIDSLDSDAIAEILVNLSGEAIMEEEAATVINASHYGVSAMGGETTKEGGTSAGSRTVTDDVTEAGEAVIGIENAMSKKSVDGIDDSVDESAEDGESIIAPTYVVSAKSKISTASAMGATSAEGGDIALVGEAAEDDESVVAATYVVTAKSRLTTASSVGFADLNKDRFDGVTIVGGGLAPDDDDAKSDDTSAVWVSDMDYDILEDGDNSDDWDFPKNWNILENLDISDKESIPFDGNISINESISFKKAISDNTDKREDGEISDENDCLNCWENILFESFRSGCVPPPNSPFSEDENPGIVEEKHFFERDLKIESTPDYDIIEWKFEKEPYPTRIIKCDCEISLLQYNPDYPTLLAGANKDGQIFLWDMNIYDVPVSVYINYMSSKYSSEIVPWTYKPPSVAYVAIESCEVYSHRDEIYDMQWVPSNSRMSQDRSMNISGKVKSSLIVTASGDGTVGVFDLQMGHPLSKNMKHRRKHVSNVTPNIPPFAQYDRHMQPVQYVLAAMNGDPIPVTAITVNNLRQWVVPGLQRTDYLNYRSMKNALKKQRPMMHACITAGLSSGQVIGMFPDLEHYEKKRDTDDPHFYKDLYWIPRNESYIQYQCFKHEGPVLCLKRSRFADDVILSVSETSFCIWKEQSRLYKERKENMPWLKSWFNEEVHGPPLHNRILPVCWRRMYEQDYYYTTGEWSPLCSSQLFLLMSNGAIEIYDMNVREEAPLATVYVGPNMIHHLLPLMCSNRCDDLAFIEDEVLFYVKMPEYCKTKNIAQFKDLQKFINHAAWRRGHYNGWCEQFNQDYREYVRERVLEANKLYSERQYGRVKGVYQYIRLMRAKAEKAKQAKKAFSDLYEDRVPGEWWNETKKRGIYGVLERKKKLMKWYEWKDIIFDVSLEDTILFKKIYEPTRVAFKPYERTKETWIDVILKNASKEYFEKYWVLRHEQTHAYDKSFVEEPDEDIAIAQIVDLRSEQYKFTALKRQREYGLIFEFVDFYEAEKIRDLGRIKERKGKLKFGALEVLVSKTMFSKYLNRLHVKKLTHAIPNLTHECNLPGATSPLNKVWDLWTLLGVIDKDHLLKTANLPPRVRDKRSAVDYTNFYFQ